MNKEFQELNDLFQDMLKEMDDGTLDLTESGNCTGCGQCCSNLLPLSESEIARIKSYIRRNKIKPCSHGNFLLNKVFDLFCPFLDSSKKDEKCKIYEVRPAICRYFICNKSKRPDAPVKELMNCSLVDVRQTFFGGT